MAEKKFLGEDGLKYLIDKIKDYDATSLALAQGYTDEQVAANKITVDSALSETSTNPVENKTIKAEFQAVQGQLKTLADQLGTTDLSGFETKTDAAAKLSEAKTYTDTEVGKITSGTITVAEAEHAEIADLADEATKATQDGNGNVIANTYETIANATSKYDEFAEDIKDLNDAINLKADIADYNESIIGLSVNGTIVTYIKGDGSMHTFETQDTNTTYSLGTDEVTGLTKLYATIGSAEDGTMTQKAIKTELDKKVGVKIDDSQNTLVFTI